MFEFRRVPIKLEFLLTDYIRMASHSVFAPSLLFALYFVRLWTIYTEPRLICCSRLLILYCTLEQTCVNECNNCAQLGCFQFWYFATKNVTAYRIRYRMIFVLKWYIFNYHQTKIFEPMIEYDSLSKMWLESRKAKDNLMQFEIIFEIEVNQVARHTENER